jgi:hypothetical protein
MNEKERNRKGEREKVDFNLKFPALYRIATIRNTDVNVV